MDFENLASELKYVNSIGCTLNIDERMGIYLQLLKMFQSQNFDQITFWGKIEGLAKDYFIAVGLNFKGSHEFPKKTFFWASSSDYIFSLLPTSINETYKQQIMQLRAPFSGQHEKILIKVDRNNEDQQLNSNSSEDTIKVMKKNFTELDRLSLVVHQIEHDCQLVPVGAVKLTPTHEMMYNDQFFGLSIQEAASLASYQHFRSPECEDKKDLIARDEALLNLKFLDEVQSDLPYGCWSIQADPSKTKVSIRSLLWPGYVGYHRIHSQIFGGAYFGNGIKNSDLPFLI